MKMNDGGNPDVSSFKGTGLAIIEAYLAPSNTLLINKTETHPYEETDLHIFNIDEFPSEEEKNRPGLGEEQTDNEQGKAISGSTSVVAPGFFSFSTWGKKMMTEAHDIMLDYLAGVQQFALRPHISSDALWQRWYGDDEENSPQTVFTVNKVISDIYLYLQNKTKPLKYLNASAYNPGLCRPGVLACAIVPTSKILPSTAQIWVCPLAFKNGINPLFGIDSLAGTILHELSHLSDSRTDDLCKSFEECENYAKYSPLGIGFSANSLEYLAETIPPPTLTITAINGNSMRPNDGILDTLIYCDDPKKTMSFSCQGIWPSCSLRDQETGKYLNQRFTGAVKLSDTPHPFTFSFKGNGAWTIYSEEAKQFMYLDGNEPYIKSAGASQTGGQEYWKISYNKHSSGSRNNFAIIGSNKIAMFPEGDIEKETLIYCDNLGGKELRWDLMGPYNNSVIRVLDSNSPLYLQFRYWTGAVKLYDTPTKYTLTIPNGVNFINKTETWNIYSQEQKQYMILSDDEPYLEANVDISKAEAIWNFIDY